jgi:tripartite-type tricarboxylate transporter receptor subunit TctC
MKETCMQTRRHFLGTLGGAAALGSIGALPATAWAARDMSRIIVGFPPGGSNDAIARLLARKLQGQYASSILVENRAGAGGRIGAEAVRRSPADGSVILQTPGSILTLYPHIYRSLPYDTLRDFTPISTVCTLDFALVTNASVVPARTLQEYVKWCKTAGGNATYGSPATGASPHFVGLMLGQAAGVKMLHVGYKGAAPAVQDLLGGQIPAYVGMLADVAPHLRSGRLRVLATSGNRRATVTPDVPRFQEAGFKDISLQDWFGWVVPAGTPAATVAALNAGVQQALRDPETLASMASLNVEAAPMTPELFRQRIERETALWGGVVKSSGFEMME